MRATAVPGARVGRAAQLAALHPDGRVGDPLAGPGQLRLELRGTEAVVPREAGAHLLDGRRDHPARLALRAPERHVDAARRLEPQELPNREHVERRLEAILALPARGLV